MFRAAVFLAVASVLGAALALISCLSVEDRREIRGLPRWAWVLVILLVPLGGPVAWFTLGRPHRRIVPETGWRPPPPPRPKAPDDDPDFLRSLDDRKPRPDA
jgi:Phospholipase_D-nuclease N-terminal